MAKRRGRGEGFIYQKPDGRWAGTVDLGWKDGRRQRKWVYGSTRQEVQGKLSTLVADKQKGIAPPDDRLTVGQFLDRWLEETAKPSLRYSSYRGYEQNIRLHLGPDLGKIRLSKLTADDVEKFINRKVDSGLSARTVQYCHGVLRAALQTAVKRGKVHQNVAALVSAPKVTRDPVKPLTVEEAQALLKAAKGDPLEAVWITTLALGLRRGEVLGLKWEDVDLEEGRLWVRHALQRQAKKGLVAVEPKSRSSRRSLPLPPFVVAVLKDHRKRQAARQLKAGPAWEDTGHVFTTRHGLPLSPEHIYKHFLALQETAKLRQVRFHDLRHSCASLLFAQGCSMRLVMEILGHSQIALTANTYTHLLPEADREGANAMEAVLGAQT